MATQETSRKKVNSSSNVKVITTSDGREAVCIKKDGRRVTRLEHTVPSWMLSEE